MKVPQTKVLLGIQVAILFVGTVFAWSKLIPQLTNFYALYGTFFRVSDCVVPNPFVTACLYGSLAFIVALFWSVRVYVAPSYTSERYLRNFLVFCVAFAGSVVLSEAGEYYHWYSSTVSVTCSPGVSPLATPCFTGLIFFLITCLISVVATGKQRQSDTLPG
ncbi:MAG: hypothetical protein WC030_01485 [Candidatus Paceibacterota bacterium]